MKVLALGGSMVFGDFDGDRVRRYAEAINRFSGKLAVVIGGGRIARNFIGIARGLGADEVWCDEIGIVVTRINAMVLLSGLKGCAPVVAKDFSSAKLLLADYDKVVMGGTFPGHTTDATAALLAEALKAEQLLIATSVDGVYSSDPRRDSEATRFEELTPEELVEIVARNDVRAGSSSVVDLLASKIIQRSRIPTVIFEGTPENVERALKGEKIGTIIRP
ncbi:UMP kinase [Geoglobus ahangari]